METRPLEALRPHLRNAAIYADRADDALIASVHERGVLVPLLVTRDGTIISGHRRWEAARRAGRTHVPVSIFGSEDEWDILAALLAANVQRAKTNEQLGREAQEALNIEHALARRVQQEAAARANRQRQCEAQERAGAAANGRSAGAEQFVPQRESAAFPRADDATVAMSSTDGGAHPVSAEEPDQVSEEAVVAILPPPPPEDTRKARDRAGDRLGISGHKTERAAAVVAAIDRLRAEGKQREAEQLRRTLNERSVQRAYDQALEAGYLDRPASRPRPQPRQEVTISLEQWEQEWACYPWEGWHSALQELALGSRPTFNSQETDNIEWAMHSWNPVTGCKHDCSYCYARDIAERFYPQKFAPTFIPARLGAPVFTKVPAEAAHNVAYRNVFTCSMADLFGKWVPREWIDEVLRVVDENRQWNFLFLTKFALRLREFSFPPNAWVGTTIDAQARIAPAERAFAEVDATVKWLSCEPMLERLTFSRLDLFDWVVIGGASRSTQTPEFRPPREWTEHLEAQARAAHCLVYEKTNLLERRREFPGQNAPPPVHVPSAFKMGYLQRDVLSSAVAQRSAALP